MTNTEPLGQRLREWREAHGLTVEETAQRLGYKPGAFAIIANIENDATAITYLPASVERDIEALINPDHDAIIDGVTAAIRGALASGCTVVRIVRPETPERGRLTVIVGDDEDEDWRRVL